MSRDDWTLVPTSRSAKTLRERISPSSPTLASTEDLAGFKGAQRLAYQCCESIAREIQVGWTEKQVTRLMDTYLRDFGVKSFFHTSFAWFGERTRFQGFKSYFYFLPSSKVRLLEGDVVILDTAPIVNGYVGDVGYTFSHSPNPALDAALNTLRTLRQEIPQWFNDGMKPDQVWNRVNHALRDQGYDNCYKQYPFSVLGHRVYKIPLWKMPGVTFPFSLHSFWGLLSGGRDHDLLTSNMKTDPRGLWAIEPHLGGKGFGAKFEEILIVGEKTRWLDDEVPHMRGKL